MKKRLSVLFTVLFMLCFVLAGCGSKKSTSAVEGTWKIVSASEESSGLEISGDQLDALGLGDAAFEFKSDGTVSLTMGTEEPLEGTYELKDDNTVTITSDDIAGEAVIDGNTMTMEETGVKIVLEKQ